MAARHGRSSGERLEAIRRHAHEGMRYQATAALRSEGQDREWALARLHVIADFMALADGEVGEVRALLKERDEIADRYLEAAKTDPWTGPCSFCGESPAVAWFEGPGFTRWVRSPDEVQAEEAWTACAPCFGFVLADDRDGLVHRGARRFVSRGNGEDRAFAVVRRAHERFWSARPGS